VAREGFQDIAADEPDNGDMADVSPSDPLEVRVLTALLAGAATADDIAVRTAHPTIMVAPILEQAVVEQTVTRIGSSRSPAYSLTPKGMHAIGLAESRPEAAAGTPVEPPPEPTPEPIPAPIPAPAPEPVSGPPGETAPMTHDLSGPPVAVGAEVRKVTWRHVLYAVLYVVLGLVFLLVLHSVIGVLVVVAGLVLGAFALRPLWRSAL
jgi:hypothetical protein